MLDRQSNEGESLLENVLTQVVKNLWHQRSYEGSMKSVPDDDLLKMLAADLDPAHVKKLMQMKTDRRLRSREDSHKILGKVGHQY